MHEYGDGLRLGISLSQMAYSFGGEVLTGKLQLFNTELDIKVISGATRRGLLVEGRKCESSFFPTVGKLHHRVQGAE